MDDITLARHVASEAGSILRAIQQGAPSGMLGTKELKDRGDREAQTYLANALATERPRDSVLSEEAKDSGERLAAHRVWIIDPLDGTREFSEGRDDWAVHVALWEDGELTAGAVALPGLNTTLTNADTPPTWQNPERTRLAVSRSRATPLVIELAEQLGAELVPMGSAGFKVAAVVRGEVDAYVHTGGQYEWDSAAPIAVARAAGLYTSRIDGSPMRYNNANPYLPDLVVSNPYIADTLMTLLAESTHREAE